MPKHILFLFTDQQRRDTIHELGNADIQTPSFDALARESTVFDCAVTPSPVCVPARMSMLSGQYPARTGCTNNNKNLAYTGKGVYDALTKAGYQSCCVGKMHHVTDYYGSIGFSKRYTQEELSAPQDDYTQFIMKNYPYVFDYNGVRTEMYYVPQVSPLPPEAHPTQWVADKSLEYLDSVDPSKPVFLMSSFIHPHPPFCPPAPWNKLYRDDLSLPYVPEHIEDFAELVHGRFKLDNMGVSERQIILLKNYYYACVSFVDYQIGRIITKLKEKGMYDDTMIIFSTDHGELLGDYNCMGKRTMVDAAAHIPLMIRRPGDKPHHCKDLVSLVDIASTLLSYAGIPYDSAEFDGLDMFGNQKHDVVFSQYATRKKGAYMVCDGTETGAGKLVYNAPDDRYYFFDTFPDDRDKYEELKDTEHVKSLKARLDAYRASEVLMDPHPASAEKQTGGKNNTHYAGRLDHVMRHDEEAGRIPPGYTIDL